MNRKAIIIEASNVSGQTDLPGARLDVTNWERFLRSDLAGAWTDGEITTLRKPLSSVVATALKVSADTYTFVAFSGHGAEGSVVLNEGYESFPISNLKPTSSRGVLVVDSCRGADSRLYNFSAIANRSNSTVLANAADGRLNAVKEARYPHSSRSAWENGFGPGTGVVQMLACAKGQGAEEDPESGGYYTSLLMAAAELWEKRTGTGTTYYTTREAHDYAVQNLSAQQTPEYLPSWLSFPFAVK